MSWAFQWLSREICWVVCSDPVKAMSSSVAGPTPTAVYAFSNELAPSFRRPNHCMSPEIVNGVQQRFFSIGKDGTASA
jgi:hypothetical protein